MNTRAVTQKYRLNKWTDIIRECQSSGQTVTAWCTEHDINPKSYYYWLKKVRLAACEALTPINSENSLIVPIDISTQTMFFARPISLFVQSGFCSAPDREFYAL